MPAVLDRSRLNSLRPHFVEIEGPAAGGGSVLCSPCRSIAPGGMGGCECFAVRTVRCSAPPALCGDVGCCRPVGICGSGQCSVLSAESLHKYFTGMPLRRGLMRHNGLCDLLPLLSDGGRCSIETISCGKCCLSCVIEILVYISVSPLSHWACSPKACMCPWKNSATSSHSCVLA